MGEVISIFHGCTVRIEKSFTSKNDGHHEMPNNDPG